MRMPSTMSVRPVLLLLVLLLAISIDAQLQQICGCQPATYTMEFDFSLLCDDGTVDEINNAGGVNQTACLTAVRDRDAAPADALIPVAVQNVQIFELDQSLQVVSQTVRPGSFMNGDTFQYTSILLPMSDSDDAADLPRGLQMVITGVNAAEESVVNTFIVTYTNDCGVFPVLREGQTAGWVTFVDLGDPPQENCPLSPGPPPTLAPDVVPVPTVAPNAPPTAPEQTRPPSCHHGKGGRHYDGDKYGTDSTSSKGGKGGKGSKGSSSGGGKDGKGKAGKGGLMKKERSGSKGGSKGGGAKAMKMLKSDRRMLGAHNGNIFAGDDECDDNDDESRDYGGTDSRDDAGKGGGKGEYRRRMTLMHNGASGSSQASQQQHRMGF